jgi:hypothetical protein
MPRKYYLNEFFCPIYPNETFSSKHASNTIHFSASFKRHETSGHLSIIWTKIIKMHFPKDSTFLKESTIQMKVFYRYLCGTINY